MSIEWTITISTVDNDGICSRLQYESLLPKKKTKTDGVPNYQEMGEQYTKYAFFFFSLCLGVTFCLFSKQNKTKQANKQKQWSRIINLIITVINPPPPQIRQLFVSASFWWAVNMGLMCDVEFYEYTGYILQTLKQGVSCARKCWFLLKKRKRQQQKWV